MAARNCNGRNQRNYCESEQRSCREEDSQRDREYREIVAHTQNSLINKDITCIEDVFNEMLQNPQGVIVAWKTRDKYPGLAELLINLGNKKLLKNQDAFICVCKKRDEYPGFADLLMNAGVDVNVEECFSKMTPLHYAVQNHDLNLTAALLKHKCIIRSDSEGNTPLHIACTNPQKKDLKIIELLIHNGADINKRNKSLYTPLLLAASSRESEEEYLLELIKFGADVTLCDQKGYTALHWAAKKDYVQFIKRLMEKNADPFAQLHRDRVGYTPLHFAASRARIKSCSALLAKLCDFRRSDEIYSENDSSEVPTLQEQIISYLLYDKKYDVMTILQHNNETIDSINQLISESTLQNISLLTNKKARKKFIYELRETYIGAVYQNELLALAKRLIGIRNSNGTTALDIVGNDIINEPHWSENVDRVRKLLRRIKNAKSYDAVSLKLRKKWDKYIKKLLNEPLDDIHKNRAVSSVAVGIDS